ncbi:ABC transporter substrate-binding protein [Natronospora cellulosivora (SeqCode)]
MKKLIILSLITFLLISFSGIVAAYTPPPGVLSPNEVDFGGETVMIYGANLADGSWVWDEFNDILRERAAEAEELFNVTIQTRPDVSNQLIQNRVLSGDSAYDIYVRPHRDTGYYTLVSNDMLYPVGEILPQEYYESLHNIDYQTAEKLAFNDQYYTFGSRKGNVMESMFFVQYNRTLLENENLADPYDMYLAGEWDYEAFEELAREVTRDTNGDGEIDQWAMYDITAEAIIRFLGTNGVEIARRDEDGKYVFNLTSPAAINALNTLDRWRNEEGILATSGNPNFEQGNVAFAFFAAINGWRHAKNNLDGEFGVVPLPMGPDVDSYQYTAFNYVPVIIPANAENPEGLVALYEFLFRQDDNRFDEHLDALIDLSVTHRDQLDVYLEGINNWRGEGDAFQYSGLWGLLLDSLNEVVAGERGAVSAMREIEPEAQAWLDDLFHQ